MKIHKNDTVKIMSGKDRGKTGKVIKVDNEKNAITVDGLNLFKKAKKSKKQGEKGEMVSVSRPLNVSKAMLVCSNCGKATRIGYRFEGNDGAKVRYCKKCNSTI